MRIKNLILVALLATTTFITGCGGDNGEKKSSDSTQKIIVGLDDEFPPMGFRNEKNEIVGFDIDLAKATAEKLGYEVEFKGIDWASKEAELKSKRVDILWNGLDITPEREQNMLFSDPYMDNRQIVFIRHSVSPTAINDEKSLAGLKVGTQAASTSDEYINKNTELKSSLAEYKTYGDFTTAFMDLENGRLDAVIGDEIVGRYYISKHPDKIDGLDVVIGSVGQFGFAFRKDDKELRDKVQGAFNEIIKDGSAKKISEQWFGKDLVKKNN